MLNVRVALRRIDCMRYGVVYPAVPMTWSKFLFSVFRKVYQRNRSNSFNKYFRNDQFRKKIFTSAWCIARVNHIMRNKSFAKTIFAIIPFFIELIWRNFNIKHKLNMWTIRTEYALNSSKIGFQKLNDNLVLWRVPKTFYRSHEQIHSCIKSNGSSDETSKSLDSFRSGELTSDVIS